MKQVLKVPAVLLVLIAVVIGLAGIGWVVFDQFLNHPHWSNTGKLQDMLGRDVSPAPWFVKTLLPFLTDAVSEPLPTVVSKSVMAPFAPGKYWLGWGWSLLDWGGMILIFMVAFGLGAGGVSLWEMSSAFGPQIL